MRNKRLNSIACNLYPNAQIQNIVRLTGGVSADVHRLDLKLSDGTTKNLVVRAHGCSHSGHPAVLEYRLLRALHHKGLPVPMPLLVDVSGNILLDPYLQTSTTGLPNLPKRIDPLPEIFTYLPEGDQWETLRQYLHSLNNIDYMESPTLLHGDFWPVLRMPGTTR